MRKSQYLSVKLYFCLFLLVGIFYMNCRQAFSSDWYSRESQHFKVIYRIQHDHLSQHILDSGERALEPLMELFDYYPSEKIIINTYDFSDYGKAGTTTLPQNFIRLEIAPLELSYETMPFNERIQWIISHELVHVIVNDQSAGLEKFSRKIFSKVPPESDQPLTVLYSYLTNPRRFTPRWHQEGIAVFMETWLSGGYGRVLGNFDEMYFRSLVYENSPFPSSRILESQTSHNSFLLETLFYLYGSRFCAYLSQTYGVEKLFSWYNTETNRPYQGFESKFESVFGLRFEDSWAAFIENEKQFQQENISRIKKEPLTTSSELKTGTLGWVTSAYQDPASNSLVFGYHKPHHLTAIARYNLGDNSIETLGSIPTPSMIDIASTAYNKSDRLLFYTTNNNKLFRDLHVMSLTSGKDRLLFKDCRIGQISISEKTKEIYGIRHEAGRTVLVSSAIPYSELKSLIDFGVEVNLQHLAVSPSGEYLLATLHKNDGSQSIILSDLRLLKTEQKFTYTTLYSDGSPEHPSWSTDEQFIYWNAYTNGVSNIYRHQRSVSETKALSNTVRGLFRPLALNSDSLFAFEFTSTGFKPVIIKNEAALRLPAIEYSGQQVLDKNPQIADWPLPGSENNPVKPQRNSDEKYSGIQNLKIHSFVPVISGFQNQKVLGVFSHIADPLYIHDLSVEVGVTPDRPNALAPRFHFSGKYEYKRRIKLGLDHNASNFYDLFNERKKGMIGNRLSLSHTKFWKYDIPHKIKQVSEVALYSGIEAINDNLVRVSRPDFMVFQSALTSSDTRRAIGSVDKEQGTEWSLTAMFFGVEPENMEIVGGGHAELGRFFTWLKPHNVLHAKLAGGYRHTQNNMAIGRFYFGGFGNRYLEKTQVKQYRKVFRFPGLPIYSLDSDRFIKGMIEHNLPPIRPGKAFLGHHYLSHLDVSWYSQGLVVNSWMDDYWLDLGAQIDVNFKHWYNLESTLSFGFARAWSANTAGNEWFLSLKLFRK